MPGFRENPQDGTGWFLWVGDPDDNAAHGAVLAWLRESTNNFQDQTTPLSNPVRGNLGEFIAYQIGRRHVFPFKVMAHTANAWAPLSEISGSGLDILWIDLSGAPSQDSVAVQEVKTTGTNSLSIADGLISDYEKLFGQNLKLTLRTRLISHKNRLEQEGRGSLAPRLTELGGVGPDQSPGVRLLPTLVHDSSLDSSAKMAAVRQAILGMGWPASAVQGWSIQLDNIELRLTRISRGQ